MTESGGTVEPFLAYISTTWKAEVEEYGYFGAVIEPDQDHPIQVVIAHTGRCQ